MVSRLFLLKDKCLPFKLEYTGVSSINPSASGSSVAVFYEKFKNMPNFTYCTRFSRFIDSKKTLEKEISSIKINPKIPKKYFQPSK